MEPDILEQLYRRCYGPAVLYTLSLCGSPQLAEDIVSEAFVKAYLSLPNDTPSFQFWLYRVCKNLWLDHLRRQKFQAGEDALWNLTDPDTPERRYIRTEQKQTLWNAIGTLAPLDRELVTLHYFSGLPLTEIAPLLGKSHAAVRQRLTRLRHTLKQRMEEQGYGF